MTDSTLNLFPDLPTSSKKLHSRKKSAYPKLSQKERDRVGEYLNQEGRRLFASGYMADKSTGRSLMLEADRFCNCGRQFGFFECRTDLVSFRTPISCNSRICEVCGRRYAQRLVPYVNSLFEPLLKKPRRGYGLFMLTLTTTTKRFGPDGPGRSDIARFYKESGKFLKLFYGKYQARLNDKGQVVERQNRVDRVHLPGGKVVKTRRRPKLRQGRGGKWVVDWRRFRGAGYISAVELGGQNNMLHCHCIVYGPYIPMSKLRAQWLALTGDSFIIDIRSVKQADKATWYVLKYIVKPPAVEAHSQLAQYAIAIKGSRRIRTGGIFFGRVKNHKREATATCCPYCLGQLEYSGVVTVADVSTHHSVPLYKMLKLMAARGSPLPLPAGYMTADQRIDAAVFARVAESDRLAGIVWLPEPYRPQ